MTGGRSLLPAAPERGVSAVVFRVLTVVVSLCAMSAVGEIVFRTIDGYGLRSLKLRRSFGEMQQLVARESFDLPLGKYLEAVPAPEGVRQEWFEERPQMHADATDPALARRSARYGNSGVYVLNVDLVRERFCGRNNFSMEHGLPFPDDPYVFQPRSYEDPADYKRRIRYRYYPGTRLPTGLRSNNFGFRGKDISIAKPPNRVRIAFVGASTTVNPHAYPFSYPELVERWLNVWAENSGLGADFDTINAGREGFKSHEIAGVVRDEVMAFAPDLVVYYEGSNQFWPSRYHRSETGVPTPSPAGLLYDYSAAFRRVRYLLDGMAAPAGEPPKPAATVEWPAHLDERDPDLRHRQEFPSGLDAILDDLDYIKDVTARGGAELVLSSFVWLAYEGMRLDLRRHRLLYDYLNTTYFPFTYGHMRRYADFQNRVLRAFAEQRDLRFMDIAAKVPQDPDLFIDGVHMTYQGLTIRAWITFLELVPILREKLSRGELPRALPGSPEPPQIDAEPRTASRAELERQCNLDAFGFAN